jgi:hypothetical protein
MWVEANAFSPGQFRQFCTNIWGIGEFRRIWGRRNSFEFWLLRANGDIPNGFEKFIGKNWPTQVQGTG